MTARSPHPSEPRSRVLITGGAKRVGAACARAFARSGCDLVLTYRTSDAAAQELQAELESTGSAVNLIQADFAQPDDAAERLSDEVERLGGLDVLVHNASLYEPSPLGEITTALAARQYAVNALAPLVISQALAPYLHASPHQGGGAIVALSDIHAIGRPRAQFAAYSMSKAALTEMVRTLAVALAPQVRVNAVAPGVVAWPEEGYESDEPAQQAYLSRVPLERAGTPEEAAEAARWLALDARYTTGQIVRVDGGRWLR